MKGAKAHSKNSKHIASGAGVLLIGSVVAKMLGALYRIPLTNILGAEGMGMYQLVFPVYALFMVLATAGIPTALSRMVAEKRAIGEDTKKYLGVAMLSLFVLGLAFAAVMAGASKFWRQDRATPTHIPDFWLLPPQSCVCA